MVAVADADRQGGHAASTSRSAVGGEAEGLVETPGVAVGVADHHLDLRGTPLTRPFDDGRQQAPSDPLAALVGMDDEIVDLDHLVHAAARLGHDAREQHGDAQHADLALRHQERRARGLQPCQHLLARMRRVVEQGGERRAVTRARQAHAYRRRQRRSVFSFNDRHLVLRLRSRRGPEALSRNTEAAGKRRLRQVTTLRAAYFSSVKYQPFWSRFVVMDIL